MQEGDRDRKIRGCTEIITKRLAKGQSLSHAYSNRGGTYDRMGD